MCNSQSIFECPVCYEKTRKEKSFTTTCRHTFCSKCYKQMRRYSSRCPICRTNISITKRSHDINYEIQVTDIVYIAIIYYVWAIFNRAAIYVNYNTFIQVSLSIYVIVRFVLNFRNNVYE